MFSGVKRLYATPRALMVTLAVLAVTATSAVAINTMQSQSAGAATQCHESLITYCGIAASTVDGRIDKFQTLYTTNRSGHARSSVGYDYRDIKQIYNHYGATDAMVNSMTSANTKLGTIYADGRIVVGGKLVGKDAVTAGRYKTKNSTLFPGTNIYMRKPIESFSTNSMPALIYFQNGVMKFGIILECGNPIKATPTTTPPKAEQTLVCVELTKTTLPGSNKYRFTATARATNGASISGYTFVLGDGAKKNVTTTSSTATVDHQYTKEGSFKITAFVNGKLNGKAVTKTAADCRETVTVKAEPVQTLVCVDLTKASLSGNNKYRFTVKALATNGASITGYTFNLGDGTEENVTTTATSATVDHEYAKDGNYTITASVNGKLNGKVVTKTANDCKETVTVMTEVEECKPGIPVGDDRCEPCPIPGKEDLPKNSPECVEDGEVLPVVAPVVTPELPKTGAAGAIALVGMTSALGAAAHSIVTRYRNRR